MGGSVPWLKIADATAANGPFLYETKEFVTESGATKSVPVAPGDLILSNSASCGIPIFVGLNGCIHDGWLHFRDLQRISKGYLYHWLQWKASHLIHIADGSVQKNLNTKLIKELPLVIPSGGVHDAFTQMNDSLFKLIDAVGRESRRLASLRDYLLPRLLSGRVRVRAAEPV
jgi:type I restriction enzyme S subunit